MKTGIFFFLSEVIHPYGRVISIFQFPPYVIFQGTFYDFFNAIFRAEFACFKNPYRSIVHILNKTCISSANSLGGGG